MADSHRNLYIFSFDMKRFLSFFILFLIPIIVFAVIAELLFRFLPNDYNYKSNYMNTHSSEIECLILGNSHSAWGIDPTCFSFNTFNLAFAGQPLIYDELLLEKYINQMTSLKYVIISVSYCAPYVIFEQNDRRSISIYPIYFDINPCNDTWEYHFEITANSPRINFSRLVNLFSKTEKRCLEYGNYTAPCISDTMQLSNSTAQRHNNAYRKDLDSSSTAFERNVCALKRILAICETKNIRLFVVIPPHTVSYVNNLDQQMKIKTMDMLQSISNSSNVCLLNFSEDIRFMDNCNFSDEDHLCLHGSEIYSRILNDTIQYYEHKCQ